MWKCTNCGGVNPESFRKCGHCMAWTSPATKRALAKLRERGKAALDTMRLEDLRHVPLNEIARQVGEGDRFGG